MKVSLLISVVSCDKGNALMSNEIDTTKFPNTAIGRTFQTIEEVEEFVRLLESNSLSSIEML